MEVWLIRDGEKAGPFHDYEIRRKIGLGELDGDSPAWHEGLPAWTVLSEIPLFRNEFLPEAVPEKAPVPTPPPLPPTRTVVILAKPRIIRRFWARWFDLYLYVALWWLLMWFTGRNIESLLTSPVVTITRLIPWFVIEILLIHRFGTTPGKWLLGIRIANMDGSRLTLGQSTHRALRVFFIGLGFALPLVTLFCMLLSAFTARRIGAPFWDHVGKHVAIASPLSPWKVPVLVVLFFSVLQLQFGVIGPVMMKLVLQDLKSESDKPIREFLEKNPPWSLPRRD